MFQRLDAFDVCHVEQPAAHPVTEGVPEHFDITDELYPCPVFESDVVPLLRSDYDFHPDNFYSAVRGGERLWRWFWWRWRVGGLVTMANRYLRNQFTSRWALHSAFPRELLDEITQSIQASERQHSAEFRFAIETALDVPTLLRGCLPCLRAMDEFSNLCTWDIAANNGALI